MESYRSGDADGHESIGLDKKLEMGALHGVLKKSSAGPSSAPGISKTFSVPNVVKAFDEDWSLDGVPTTVKAERNELQVKSLDLQVTGRSERGKVPDHLVNEGEIASQCVAADKRVLDLKCNNVGLQRQYRAGNCAVKRARCSTCARDGEDRLCCEELSAVRAMLKELLSNPSDMEERLATDLDWVSDELHDKVIRYTSLDEEAAWLGVNVIAQYAAFKGLKVAKANALEVRTESDEGKIKYLTNIIKYHCHEGQVAKTAATEIQRRLRYCETQLKYSKSRADALVHERFQVV